MNTPSRPRFAAAAFSVLALLLSLPLFAAEPASTKNYAGLNVWLPRDWDAMFPFADVMHFSRRWLASTDSATGFPTNDFQGVFVMDPNLVNGIYTLKFTGQATLSVPSSETGRVTITNQTWDSNTASPTYNQTTATVTANYPYNPHAPKQIEIIFSNTKRLPTDAPGTGATAVSLVENTTLNGTTITYRAITDSDEWPATDGRVFVVTGANLPLGVYKLQFTGQATIADAKLNGPTDTETYFTISGQTYNATTHVTTADLTVLQPTTQLPTININFTNTRRFDGTTLLGTNTGITNVRLWRPGYNVAVNAPIGSSSTPLFATEYKTQFTNAQVVRLMEWNDTNTNPTGAWDQRTRPGHATWQRLDRIVNDHGGDLGVPYEIMVRLCNELNADLYINVPILADFGDANQTYAKNLAKLIRYGSDGVNPYSTTQASPVWAPLNSNLKVYIEYGNETWNAASAYYCYRWSKKITDDQLADPAVYPVEYDGETNEFKLRNRYIAMRTAEISQAFRTIFGDAAMMTRVRPLFVGQKGNPTPGGQLTDGMTFLDKFYSTTNAFNPTAHPVNYFLYGGGASSYYDVTTVSSDPNTFFAPGNWPEPNYTDAIQLQALWMGNYGLKSIAYEGGMDLKAGLGLSAAQARVLNADSRMQGVVQDYHDLWTANGGTMFVYYVVGGPAATEFAASYNTYNSPKQLALASIVGAASHAPINNGNLIAGTNTTPVTATEVYRNVSPPTIRSGVNTATDTATGELVYAGYSEGDYLIFGVSTTTANTYKCSLRYSLGGTVSTAVDVYVNGVLATTATLAGTSGVLTDSPLFDVDLPEGFVTIRLTRKVGSGGSATMSMRSATFTLPDVTSGLIGRWKFDGNAQDSSGTGKNGTVTGTPTYSATGVPVGAQAINLSGTGQYVTLTGYNGITGSAARTATAWVKTTASGTIRPIIAWGTTATGSKWVVAIDATGHFRVEVSSGSITSTATINDGQWHHVAVTFANDGTPNIGDAKLYVDSVLDTSPTVVSQTVNTVAGTAAQIGRDQSSRLWSGALDDVRLYDRALTAAEIEALFYQAQ